MDPYRHTGHHREVWRTPSECVVVVFCFVMRGPVITVVYTVRLHLHLVFVTLQKSRIGRFVRRSSSFSGNFCMLLALFMYIRE